MKRKTKKGRKPELVLHTGGGAKRSLLLREEDRRALRETMSSCTVDPDNLPDRTYPDWITGLFAKRDDQRRADSLAAAESYAALAKTARGMHIKNMRDYAAMYRRDAAKGFVGSPLPVRKDVQPYLLHGAVSTEYANTMVWAIYDPAGRRIVDCRVTASPEAHANAMLPLEEIAELLQRAARNGLGLVSA